MRGDFASRHGHALGIRILALLLVTAGCTTAGVFHDGGQSAFQELRLHADGTFEYVNWSEDAGTICTAIGTWSEGPGDSVTTRVAHRQPQGSEGCLIADVQEWRKDASSLRDESGKLFRKAARPDPRPTT